MNRGAGRRVIFKTDEQRLIFIGLLKEIYTRYSIEIHAYCLMGNHFHLLIRTPEPTLSDGLQFLSGTYTKRFNRIEKLDGPLFRGRFKAVLIDADDYLVEVSRYIHRNPVEAKLVEMPSSFPWSSYYAYLNPEQAPDWLYTNEVLKRAGAMKDGYRDLVEKSRLPTLKAFY
jgi:REP element-mobilizing transposase RayT